MADGTVLNLGSGGNVLFDEDAGGGVHRAWTKIFLGIYGSNEGAVGTKNPLPDRTMCFGLNTTALASGTGTSPVVVKASSGFICSVLVTAAGSANLILYDNASAASGTIVGYVPSSATAGQIYQFMFPCANGITAGQSVGSVGGTVSWG